MSNNKLQQWQEEVIRSQFKAKYGLKQLVQDGKDEALRLLANITNFNYNVLKQNLQTIKKL